MTRFMRFSIQSVLWATLMSAILLAWWTHYRRMTTLLRQREAEIQDLQLELLVRDIAPESGVMYAADWDTGTQP